MSETPVQPKTTPARRRQPRNAGRSAGQKAYASENDVANMDPARYDRFPRTPQKTDLDSPAPQGTQLLSKQRSRNKPRAKNMPTTSPESGRAGRQTPPQTTSSLKSAMATPAFAGATFHASPAPSALPLPSFLARPPTDSPSIKARPEVRQEPSPPTDSDGPSPPQPSSVPAARESPLDFMFRAHRQEMIERQRRESANGPRPTVPSTVSPFESHSLPKPSTLPQTARSRARLRSNGIESDELDGTPGKPLGPAFATPYHERIKAARSASSHSAHAQDRARVPSDPASEDPAEALKKFLFSNTMASLPQRGPPSFPTERSDPGPRSSSAVHPPADDRQIERPTNIRAMEDDLKRILKLDISSGSPATERRLFP